MTTRKKHRVRAKEDLNLRHPEPGPAASSDWEDRQIELFPNHDSSSSGLEVSVVQGGERRGTLPDSLCKYHAISERSLVPVGWLRSNDRTMIVVLTFQHLCADEKRRWLGALRGRETDPAEIELGLKYDDCCTVVSKKRGQYPERVRLVKFESSIKNDSDVVLLWGNMLTLVLRDGSISLKQQSGVANLGSFYKVEEERGSICIKFKLTTNITSKSHQNRRFRFTARAARGMSVDAPESPLLSGESYDFELIAKHRTESGGGAEKPPVSIRSAPVERTAPAERYERPERPEKVARVERAPVEDAESLILLEATTDGDLITCTGVDESITNERVVAHLLQPVDEVPDSNSRTRKRKFTSTRKHVLKRHEELCEPGKFVAHLPSDLPSGTYHVKMVGTARMGESNSIAVYVEATAAGQFPLEGSEEDSEEQVQENNEGCITPSAISDITKMWPERKSYPDDDLLPDAPDAPAEAPNKKCLEIIPAADSLMLDYCRPIIASSAQALTRSLSEENIAKIVNNCELFDDVELGADVDSLTRNMIGGFNMEGGCDLDSLQFRMGQQDDYNSDYKSDEDNQNSKPAQSHTLCRQAPADSTWSEFLVSDDIDDSAAAGTVNGA